jgi:hypothetical protein
MSNCKKEAPMPLALGGILGASRDALTQSKINRALEGDKVYTRPKTIFGKLIGGVTGRTAAAEASESLAEERVFNSLGPNTAPQNMNQNRSTPITGGFSFGGEAGKKTYLPFAIVAAVVAVFYLMRKKGRGRRR